MKIYATHQKNSRTLNVAPASKQAPLGQILQSQFVQKHSMHSFTCIQREEVETATTTVEGLSLVIAKLNDIAATGELYKVLNTKELRFYISELEKIAKSNDRVMQNRILEKLETPVNNLNLETKLTNSKSTEEDTEGVVQGKWFDILLNAMRWSLDASKNFLKGSVEVAKKHPKFVIAASVVAAVSFLKIAMEIKRQKLPAGPMALAPGAGVPATPFLPFNLPISSALFNTDIEQFCILFTHKCQDVVNQYGMTSKDYAKLKYISCVQARKTNDDGGTFSDFVLYIIPTILNLVNFSRQRIIDMATLYNNLLIPFEMDMVQISAKNQVVNAITPANKTAFSLALQTLPFVANLIAGQIHHNMTLSYTNPANNLPASWKNHGYLQDGIQQILPKRRILHDNSEIQNGNFKKKVVKTDKFIKQLVDPAILITVARPKIAVHLQNKQTPLCPFGFRAFYQNNIVHVAQNEEQSTIAHEVGHHLEDKTSLPGKADIMLLLRSRNAGAPKAEYFYPTLKEQRYAGDYPATGKYTSKYYPYATEVMSMSVEYLSHPDKFMMLIQDDPVQAAIILRILRPAEFAAQAAPGLPLAPFLPFIP